MAANGKKKRLLWQIYPTYLLVIILPLIAILLYAMHSLQQFYVEQVARGLNHKAILIADELGQLRQPWNRDEVKAMCVRTGSRTGTRVTVIGSSGEVLGDSEKNPADMENHSDRDEFIAAMKGGVGQSIHYSGTLRRNMLYIACPYLADGKVTAVVRTSVALAEVGATLKGFYHRVGIAVAGVLLLALFVSFVVSQYVTRPLEEMKEGAERFARGDFSGRLSLPETRELYSLANSMNMMAAELKHRIEALDQQRRELETVLASMEEGIVVLDGQRKIVRVNRAARNLLWETGPDPVGTDMGDAVSGSQFRIFTDRVMANREPVETDMVLSGEHGKHLHVEGAVVRDRNDQPLIAIITIDDMTRIRRLEESRRDFIANVSHELKTPITNIKGFVETLRDGATENPEDLARFLGIIAKQTERLQSIVNDILSLSRIEHFAERGLVELEPRNVVEVLKDAVEICADRAAKKNMKIKLNCPDKIAGMFNAALLEQAVVNLVDNAVKYAGDGGTVEIEGKKDSGEVLILVRDNGPGIEKEHQARIFERFYRVDKSRSRQLGGTGLGLSIVKHIALAHGGSVAVESEPGKGSTFTIRIQAASAGHPSYS